MSENENMGKQFEPIKYIGNEKVLLEKFDGGLRPVIGVQCCQAFRANREMPELAEGSGWTYNHQPYLAYWNNWFYLEYLSCPVGENQDKGQTLLVTSKDGIHWSRPEIIFPKYEISEGLYSVMHQRMGFYTSKSNRLLALAFYGPACPYPWPDIWNMPNDGNGIGRAVREVYMDGSLGPIYFIRYNSHAGWDEGNTKYPLYRTSRDLGFVEACDELLSDKLMTQQWWEEDRSKDGFYTTSGGKGFSYYHRKDGKTVGLWKWSKAALSDDNGKTWSSMADLSTFVMAGAKVWGQKTADSRYAVVYNPTSDNSNRWPLAVVTGEDGENFENMLCVHGEVAPRRYSGFCKDMGAQYIRGIEEGNGVPPGKDMWLTYSMNKEDIWVTRVPLPIRHSVTGPVADNFDDMEVDGVVRDWNIYSGQWASVNVVDFPLTSNRCLQFRDKDPYEYAKAFRVFQESKAATIKFKLWAEQNTHGALEIEVLDKAGNRPVRICLDQHGKLATTKDSVLRVRGNYCSRSWMDMEIRVDAENCYYDLIVDGKVVVERGVLAAKVDSVERLSFRTGNYRGEEFGKTHYWTMHDEDMPHAGIPVKEAIFYIDDVMIINTNL